MTAVEWLAKELEDYGNPQVCEINWEVLDALINQAKQIEQKQHETTFHRGINIGALNPELDCEERKQSAEHYYNQMYGKQ